MSCNQIFERLGFDCQAVPLKNDSHTATYISTPIQLASGDLLGFMLVQISNEKCIITDNGDTLFELMGSGFEFENRNRLKAITNIASRHGLVMKESGEIFGEYNNAYLQNAAASWLGFSSEVSAWQSSKLNEEDQSLVLFEEVEIELRAWKPNENLVLLPEIVGRSNDSHKFDYKLGNCFIDAFKPDKRTTGSKLRKAIDIHEKDDETDILMIIDDRYDELKAKQESVILSSTIRTMTLSNLMRLTGQH